MCTTVVKKRRRRQFVAGADPDGNGFVFEGYNKTGKGLVELYTDDYGNGVVGAYNRKGKGRRLESGPRVSRDTTGDIEECLMSRPIW